MPRLLVLPPDRIERELRAAEDTQFWAHERERAWRHKLGIAARFWGAGVWLLGWSLHTQSPEAGQIMFWIGLLLAALGPSFLISAFLEEAA